MTEETSAEVGSIAARGWRDPSSLTLDEIRSVCASAVTQRPDHAVTEVVAEVVANVDQEAVRRIVDDAVTKVTLTADLALRAAMVIRSLLTFNRLADHIVRPKNNDTLVASDIVRELESL